MRSLFLLLAGCPAVTTPQYDDRVRDLDGDGAIAERFGGPDCRDDDPTITDCDVDGDGVRSIVAGGTDCDDTDPDVSPDAEERCNTVDDDCDGLIDNQDPDLDGAPAFFGDRDGDGAGDPSKGYVCQEYTDPSDPDTALHASNDDDCDDGDPAIGPSSDEVCDGRDNDCDGLTDDVGLWLEDLDGDGYGADGTQAVGPCELQPDQGVASIGGDCDDTDPAIHPGASEPPYDGVDSNCNGGRDDWDADFDGYVPSDQWAAAQAANALLPPQDQWDLQSGDCDDSDPRAFDGAIEVCDGVDNDCDGAIDTQDLDGAGPTDELILRSQLTTWYRDDDGDGSFGTAVTLCPAEVVTGIHSPTGDDCYDGGPAPAGFAGADPAQVNPAQPEACNGYDDDCDGLLDYSFTSFAGSIELWVDNDGDGFGSAARFGCAADPGRNLVVQGEDCNDGAANVFPGAPEICGDAVRQDCSDAHIFDCDGDGAQGSYVGGGDGSDCEDQQPTVNPSATVELCDGLDNDCDGLLDSADVDDLDAGSEPLWFPDLDGDGFGFDDGSGVQQCDQPVGRAPNDLDCDDGDPSLTPETVWYADLDGDGFGDASTTFTSCTPPPDTVRVAGDCDDTQAAFSPGATWSFDADGDGFGASGSLQTFCAPPAGEPWISGPGLDCADDDAARYPGAPELADGIDNDCDGVIDGGSSGIAWYTDADGDGYGAQGTVAQGWAPGRVLNADDCDDTRSAVNPSAQVEICDGLDNNCDGFAVAGDPDVSNPWDQVALADEALAYLATDPTGDREPRVVHVCNEPHQDVLDTPEGPFDLTTFGLPALLANPDLIRACSGGTLADLYLPDIDGDGAPAISSLADVWRDCGGNLPPAGYVSFSTDLDCAPDDPDLRVQVEAGEYGDLDGDGAFSPWSTPFQCVAETSTMAGHDCNDASTATDGFDVQGASIEVPSSALSAAVSLCDHAEIVPQSPSLLDPSVLAARTDDFELTLRGPDDDPQALTLTGSGVVAFDGTLHLQDLSVLGTDHEIQVRGELTLENVESENTVYTCLEGTLTIEDSTLSGLTGRPTFQVLGPDAAGFVRRSTVSSFSGGRVEEGYLQLEDVEANDLAQGFQADLGGTLEVFGMRLDDVRRPFETDGGASAWLSDLELDPPVTLGAITANSGTVHCERCRVDAPGAQGPAFVAAGGHLELEDVQTTLTGDAAIEVTAGTLDATGLTIVGTGLAIHNHGQASVRESVLTRNGVPPLGASAAVILVESDATSTTLQQVELVNNLAQGPGIEVEGGSLIAEDLVFEGNGTAVQLDSDAPHELTRARLSTNAAFSSTTIATSAGQLVVEDSELRATSNMSTTVQTSGTASVTLRSTLVEALDASSIGIDFGGGPALVLEQSQVSAGGTAIRVASNGMPGSAPLFTMERSRAFTTGSAPVLSLVDTNATVRESLLHAPAGDPVLLLRSPTELDRVTVFTEGTSGVLDVQNTGGLPLYLRNTLLTSANGDGTDEVLTCDEPTPLVFQDVLFHGTVGTGCPTFAFWLSAASEGLSPSLDPATLFPTDAVVRSYFGEAALPAPYPGGF